jgi:glycine hydroxymethyltransferase
VFSQKATAFQCNVQAYVRETTGDGVTNRLEHLVSEHDEWRTRKCLNLNPAEGLLSERCRSVLGSDLAARLTEGAPGDKQYPHGNQTKYADEFEAIVLAQASQLWSARYVEWRPISTSMALATVFHALLRPGDVVLAQAADGGGNYAYSPEGPLGLAGANILPLPWSGDHFEIDVDGTRQLAVKNPPRMIVVGGSNVLFPYPVRELRRIADASDAILVYDAAHLGLLIAEGSFQRPLAEGAHIVVVSTHKSMGGPVGGLVLMNDPVIAKRILQGTFPAFMQTRDLNKYASQAIALTEAVEFGAPLARQMVANAQALANALHADGIPALAEQRGYTQTHQLFLKMGSAAHQFEERCHAANILLSDCALSGDISRNQRYGARLATHELTRRGMVEKDMRTVASLIVRAASNIDASTEVAKDVGILASTHPRVAFSFDPQ